MRRSFPYSAFAIASALVSVVLVEPTPVRRPDEEDGSVEPVWLGRPDFPLDATMDVFVQSCSSIGLFVENFSGVVGASYGKPADFKLPTGTRESLLRLGSMCSYDHEPVFKPP